MFENKYLPNTQKALFHKDIVNHIRKWIKNIEELGKQELSNMKKILLLIGPSGCGKTTSFNVLFKSFNIIDIDSLEIRSSERINELTQSIVGYKDKTLSNIGSKNIKDKPNIVLLDNIELCEKTLDIFISTVHTKKFINIPIILIGNSIKLKEFDFVNKTKDYYTYIEFPYPSLLELTKFSLEINTKEKLDLTKTQIKQIIEHSQYDTRQLLYILEQWKLSKLINNKNFNEFLEKVDKKELDIDLQNKLSYLFDTNKKFDMDFTHKCC
jgi:DNA polymerase III delta prime subunit